MFEGLRKLPLLAAVYGVVCFGAASASAALINSYDFNGDLTDTLGNGADLVAGGGNLATPGRYSFDRNQGLTLNSALTDPTDYAIEFSFQMATNDQTWKKLLDFESLSLDEGFYVLNDGLQFFNTTPEGPGSIPLNTDVLARIERDGGTGAVSGFLDGILQWTFADTSSLAVPSGNILNFFIDDTATGQGEAFAGSVDFIRIFDQSVAVPEPGILGLLGLGLVALGLAKRRQA